MELDCPNLSRYDPSMVDVDETKRGTRWNVLRTIRTIGLSCMLTWTSPSPLLAASPPDSVADSSVTITTPQGTVIQAELADTAPKRARGLMFRESLPPNGGMLFTFSESQEWAFWMKNTRIPLDIIWLDKNKTIVYVERNVPICTRTDDSCPNYQSPWPALYVLELPGGRAEILKLQKGVKLKFDTPPSGH